MSRPNLILSTVSCLVLAGLAGCASTSTASADDPEAAYKAAIEAASAPATPEEIAQAERSDPLTKANFWAEEYRKDSANLETIVPLMRALRGIGSHDRAIEIAMTSLPIHPQSHEIFLELGRSLTAKGEHKQAVVAFARSADFSPETDATALAALGVAFDRTGEHDKAQRAYAFALDREPERTSTLANFGLSLALTGDLEAAEEQLRKAASMDDADSRVRQNLVLILGLQGRFDEVAEIDPYAPKGTMESNRMALERMLGVQKLFEFEGEIDLDTLDQVKGPETEMPAVREEALTEEVMLDLPDANAPLNLDGAADAVAAESTTEEGLRPRLRGSQGG
ncbi:MAG: hypothetical protein QNI84_13540 [Henriciella sp.]|nr:hypothetical protein [Henriciella sp.]